MVTGTSTGTYLCSLIHQCDAIVTSLYYSKVYYITCPEITKSFAFYPETPTGKTGKKKLQYTGSYLVEVIRYYRYFSHKYILALLGLYNGVS
jgi:hypothetical protein